MINSAANVRNKDKDSVLVENRVRVVATKVVAVKAVVIRVEDLSMQEAVNAVGAQVVATTVVVRRVGARSVRRRPSTIRLRPSEISTENNLF